MTDTSNLKITGMTCQHCVKHATEALEAIAGVQSVIVTLNPGAAEVIGDAEQAQEIISRRLQLDKEETAALWDDFNFDISLDKSLLVTLEDEARWAINNNLTEQRKVPDYLDFIYSVPLKKVKPQAVTLIQ